jgi:hypothetical protein
MEPNIVMSALAIFQRKGLLFVIILGFACFIGYKMMGDKILPKALKEKLEVVKEKTETVKQKIDNLKK